MIKERLFRNTVGSGLLLGLGSMAATAALLTLGLLIAGLPLGEHLRWYAACFIPPILLLRHSVHLQHSTAVKTIFVTLFLTLIPYLAFLLKSNILQPQ